jgi:hypothetical protein
LAIGNLCRLGAQALMTAIFCFVAAPVQAMEPAARNAITATADAICGSYEKSGSSRSNSLGGEVSAEINGLLSRLADLGLKGTASKDTQRYEGVLREQLGSELQSIRDCRLKVFAALKGEIDQENASTGREESKNITINTSILDQISRNCSVFDTSMPINNKKKAAAKKTYDTLSIVVRDHAKLNAGTKSGYGAWKQKRGLYQNLEMSTKSAQRHNTFPLFY